MDIEQSFISFSGDTVTPVSIYLKIRDAFPGAVLLEGADAQPGSVNYSYIGILPIAEYRVQNNIISSEFPNGELIERDIENRDDVISGLKEFLASFVFKGEEPEGIDNGLFGYSTYNCIKYFEDINVSDKSCDTYDIADMRYRFYRFVIAFNHYSNTITILENAPSENYITLKKENLKFQILHRDYANYKFEREGDEFSYLSDEEHLHAIEKCKEHIQRGDVFQIVPSRLFKQSFVGDDFMVYRALRQINPSPYLFYFDFDDFKLFGSSPEAHLVVRDNEATLFPIAGTYKRTRNKEKDVRNVQELLVDEKENAEHVMLVDLARNDLSRFCEDVSVSSYKDIKEFSHVIHIASEIKGKLKSVGSSLDIFSSTFPMGTLTGAPKYKAMEILEEVESVRRNIYGGAVGIMKFNGDINHAIAIRSFLSKDNELFYQAGGGVVSDSDPKMEVEEVANKLGALRSALDLAEKESL